MSTVRRIIERLSRDEGGFTIIEVMVSALIVVIISVGVLKAFDTASATSGFAKYRAEAANVATEDLERMRGYTASKLNGYQETRTRTVNNVDFTVKSETQWLADSSGTRSCTNNTDRAEYLKLTSTVSWPGMKSTDQKVVQTSLFAPPNGSFGELGGMGIKVQDRDGAGVAGVTVSATGPSNQSATTTADGCVFFAYIKTGTYTVTASKPNLVNPQGVETPSITVGVERESTAVASIDYDQAGAIKATVTTKKNKGTGASATAIAVDPDALTLGHSQFDSPGTKAFNLSTMRSATGVYTFPKLFPFASTYAVYSGGCTVNAPATATTNAVATPSGVVTRGGTTTVAVPEVALRIKWGSGVGQQYFGNETSDGDYAVSKAGPSKNIPTTVKVSSTTSGCFAKSGNTTTTTNNQGWFDPTGTDSDPSVPFGRYNICVGSKAKYVYGRDTYYLDYYTILSNVLLGDVNGVEVQTSTNVNDYQSGTCP